MKWYHIHLREEVALVDKVAEEEPIDKTIKVTETNQKRLNKIVGELMTRDGEQHSHNDAINCLFDCKEKLEKITKEKTNES